MPVLWDSKDTFVSVSQFCGLDFCYPVGSVSGPFITPCLIVSLGRRKGGGKEGGKKTGKHSADFKPTERVLLVFLNATGSGGQAGIHFSPLLWFCGDWDQVLATIFTVVLPPAQVLCELPGSNHPLCHRAHSAGQACSGLSGSDQPLSLFVCSGSHTQACGFDHPLRL